MVSDHVRVFGRLFDLWLVPIHLKRETAVCETFCCVIVTMEGTIINSDYKTCIQPLSKMSDSIKHLKFRGASNIRQTRYRGASNIRQARYRGASNIRQTRYRGASNIRPGIEEPQTLDRPGIEEPQTLDRPGTEEPQTLDRPGMEEPQTLNRSGIEEPQTLDRPGIEEPQILDRPGLCIFSESYNQSHLPTHAHTRFANCIQVLNHYCVFRHRGPFLRESQILMATSTSTIRNYLLTYLLTPCSRVLTEKLIGSQKSQKIPRIFMEPVSSLPHLQVPTACPCPESDQSSSRTPPPHHTYWRYRLILSSYLHLGLPSGLFPSGFPTKTLYPPLLFPINATSRNTK